MANTNLIQIRIDDKTKKQADLLFSALGMDTPTAIRLFLKQSIRQRRIPFDLVVDEDLFDEQDQKKGGKM